MSKRAPENIAGARFLGRGAASKGSKPRGDRAAGETGFAATRRSLRAVKSELPGKRREEGRVIEQELIALGSRQIKTAKCRKERRLPQYILGDKLC